MSILPKQAESARIVAAQRICPFELLPVEWRGAHTLCQNQTRALLVFDEAWLDPNLWNRDKRR
jgi:hypothetical protein